MGDLIFWFGLLVYISIGLLIYGLTGEDDTDLGLMCALVWPLFLFLFILFMFADLVIKFGNFIGRKIRGE